MLIAAKCGRGGADALPEQPHPVLLLRANDLCFGARSVNFLFLVRTSPNPDPSYPRGRDQASDGGAASRLRWRSDDVREMVELATHTDHLEARARVYGERWIALWHRLYGNAIAETQQAIAGLVDRTRDYSAALINERVPTRLGDGSVDVEVDGGLISPFTGERIKVLSIRRNWLRNAEPGSMAHVVSIEATGRTTLDVDGVRFHYDVEGLHRA